MRAPEGGQGGPEMLSLQRGDPSKGPCHQEQTLVEAMAWHRVKNIISIKPLLCARSMLHLLDLSSDRSDVCQTDGGFVSVLPLNQVAVDAVCFNESGILPSGWINAQV